MSTANNGTATATSVYHAPDHERTAAGLSSHVINNRTHKELEANDGYEMKTRFDVTTKNTGIYHGPQIHAATADLLNDLLMQNHTKHHVYFSETGGFHNHHAHHLLAAYAMGATPKELQAAYNNMEPIQRPRFPVDEGIVNRMKDAQEFKSMLGDDRHFHNYLAFFIQKFEEEGWQKVTTDYLFSGEPIAEDLFVRLFAGIWHNLILVGYGIEFQQPGIVAEGLAGCCVHSSAFGPYLLECEKLARQSSKPCRPLVDLLQDIRNNPALIDKEHWHGGHSFAYDDNVTSNAPPGMAELASQWKVGNPQDLPHRTVEMINVNAFIAGAAQRPEKVVKIDFVFIHHINAALFFSVFLKQDWMSNEVKTRLLEAYTRLNLLTYASLLAPDLLPSEVVNYKPLVAGSTWSSIISRALNLDDDGHVTKLVRAFAHGEQASKPWEQEDAQKSRPLLPVKGEMWLQLANMAIDSTETEPDIVKRWVRGAGNDEAWAVFPDRNIEQ